MSKKSDVEELQVNFFIHLWLEDEERGSWRGRVNDGDGGHSSAFEDEQTLLRFIRDSLARESIVLQKQKGVL